MADDVLACLYDIRSAAIAIIEFRNGKSLFDYEADDFLRSAIERKFEIMGEALTRIRKTNAPLLDRIRDHRRIISFRNILVHGYDSIDNEIVWGIIENDLDQLLTDVETLLNDFGSGAE